MSTEAIEIDATAEPALRGSDLLRVLLRRKFPADQYAMLYEVRDAAGFGATRSADVVMVGLWPSRGCLIEGMELKVSRSDWLRELKKPQKAEAFVPYCDRWWIVAADASIVKQGELPPTWGLLVASGRSLRVEVEAPALQPQPVDRSLLAAMLKRATATGLDTPEVKALVDMRVKAARERFQSDAGYEAQRVQRQLDDLRASVKAFEEASGVSISAHAWRAGSIGKAVRSVLDGEDKRQRDELRHLKDRALRLAEWFTKEFPEPTPAAPYPFCHHPERCTPAGRCLAERCCAD